MKSLIACLGYDLDNGKIPEILENRLDDTIGILEKDNESIALMMGSRSYRDNADSETQAKLMKEYVVKKFPHLSDRVYVEDKTTSTVEQLCLLRKMVDQKDALVSNVGKIIIVSSEIVNERIKILAEYIFGNTSKLDFIGSTIPEDIRSHFLDIESYKLKDAEQWLSGHKKGDYETILAEHQDFQKKIKKGKVNHPRS